MTARHKHNADAPPPSSSVLDEMRALPHSKDTEQEQAARRQRVLSHLDSVRLRQRGKSRGFRGWRTGGLVALAAVALGALVVWPFVTWQRSPTVSVPTTNHGGETAPSRVTLLSGGVLPPLPAGGLELSELRTLATRSSQPASLRLPSAATLVIAPSSQVGLRRESRAAGKSLEHIVLSAGRVELNVPPLGRLRALQVQTLDTLVEVHGTRFAVAVSEAGGQMSTRVVVSEGVVSVQSAGRTRRLSKGETWTSAPAPPLVLSPQGPDAHPQRNPPATAAPRTLTTEQPATVTPSPLAEQNRLLQAAQLARRNGMPALALERLKTLIERYPRSELTHNALVERFRLLASMGEAAKARNAANEYLKRYPGGFARAEAERLGGPAQ